MLKKYFIFLITLSLIAHCIFAWHFPLIADELNVWNMLDQHRIFSEFWQYFIKYDTHQPLFHVAWFPFFNNSYNEFTLRVPSILLYLGSIYYWSKLFSYKDPDNQIPWILFLFAPFLTMYSVLFLPYSLLIFASVYNFYRFQKLTESFSAKSISFFIFSCLLLLFTHYYGALQAILLSAFFIYQQKNVKLKIISGGIILVLLTILLTATDFISDFTAVHSYRKLPSILDLAGEFNLLIGGKFVALILLIIFIVKKKIEIFKTKEFLFIATVVSIAYIKSFLISPSLEARYLLILIYPVYFLSKGFQFKYSAPILVSTGLISLVLLTQSFGPSFVINYDSIKRTQEKTGLLITPCPKFYFREENYICKSYFMNGDGLKEGVEKILVHRDHIDFFNKLIPANNCKPIDHSLVECTF